MTLFFRQAAVFNQAAVFKQATVFKQGTVFKQAAVFKQATVFRQATVYRATRASALQGSVKLQQILFAQLPCQRGQAQPVQRKCHARLQQR